MRKTSTAWPGVSTKVSAPLISSEALGSRVRLAVPPLRKTVPMPSGMLATATRLAVWALVPVQ